MRSGTPRDVSSILCWLWLRLRPCVSLLLFVRFHVRFYWNGFDLQVCSVDFCFAAPLRWFDEDLGRCVSFFDDRPGMLSWSV